MIFPRKLSQVVSRNRQTQEHICMHFYELHIYFLILKFVFVLEHCTYLKSKRFGFSSLILLYSNSLNSYVE